MINLVAKTNSVAIENTDNGEVLERQKGLLHYNLEDDKIEIIDMCGRNVTDHLRPYTSFTISGAPVADMNELITWMRSNFFRDASSGGGVPTLADGDFIVGGASGNEERKILPKDLGWTTLNNRVFVTFDGSSFSTIQLSQNNAGGSIAQRNGSGQVRANKALADNDCVILSQFSGVTNDALTASETRAALNTLYPNFLINEEVRSITNSVAYRKISATQWQKIILDILS